MDLGPLPEQTPRFRQIGPGVYDSLDGRVTMYRVPGVDPPAWNVEWQTQYTWMLSDVEITSSDTLLVDGAATKRDALALFADEWPRLRERAEAAEALLKAEQDGLAGL
jgi:hypothetical protein